MEPKTIKQERDVGGAKEDLISEESIRHDSKSGPHIASDQRLIRNVNTNGSFSPHSTMNGTTTPSPPTLTSLASPPATTIASNSHVFTQDPQMNGGYGAGPVLVNGANGIGLSSGPRQLTKVRRFLSTLQQFATDISVDVGEKVRTLILDLLSGSISVEDFHCALQEVTHFPLRPFVLPFLRSHLPILARELQSLARRSGIPTSQYITLQETNILDATAGEPTDFFSSEVSQNKRKSCYMDNGDERSSNGSNANNGGGAPNGSVSPPPSKRAAIFSPSYPSMGLSPELTLTSKDMRSSVVPPDDEWKNIHVMLTCILSMVEKTRRALTILQQREDKESPVGVRYPPYLGDTRHFGIEVKRHAAELVATAIRSTEDRVAEVKRKAEEAVQEVRKAAIVEVQRAVANAEAKAQELISAERTKIETLLREVSRREMAVDHKVEPHLACWNCGRKAQDTCSGCNVAKYCSSFCQHKDWDHHHKICSPSLGSTSIVTPGNPNNKGGCNKSEMTKVD